MTFTILHTYHPRSALFHTVAHCPAGHVVDVAHRLPEVELWCIYCLKANQINERGECYGS